METSISSPTGILKATPQKSFDFKRYVSNRHKTSKSPLAPNAQKALDAPCDLMRSENFCLVAAYFTVGLAMTFMATPLNIYMVQTLNAEPQQQNVIYILQALPWSLKLIFGFLSDAVPIYGMHRKPYLCIGFVLNATAFMTYALVGIQDIGFLALCLFLGTLGLILMDVMCDTMCVERSKFEEDAVRGQMQSSCYSFRFGGSLLGALFGSLVTNESEWGWGLSFQQIIFLNGFLPILLISPWLAILREKYHKQNEMSALKILEMRALQTEKTVTASPRTMSRVVEVLSTPVEAKGSEGEQLLRPKSTTALVRNKSFVEYESLGLSERALMRADSFRDFQESRSKSKAAVTVNVDVEGENRPILMRKDSFVDDPVLTETDVLAILNEELDESDAPPPIVLQIQEIWGTVQLKAVWRPMAFVYLYGVFQIPNVAWQSYLQLTLDFPAWILGFDVLLGSIMTFAGILAYKYYFFGVSWRNIYIYTTLLTAFFSLLQLILIFQLNTYLHICNYVFSLGDDVITAYVAGIQFLPVCIMYMRLCPEGAEGSSYSMLTTFGNIAMTVSQDLGNYLSGIWNVSNSTLEKGNVSGLWKLTVLTSCLQIFPMIFLWLLPNNAADQENLGKSKERSFLGGFVFLFVLFASLFFTIFTAISKISDPSTDDDDY